MLAEVANFSVMTQITLALELHHARMLDTASGVRPSQGAAALISSPVLACLGALMPPTSLRPRKGPENGRTPPREQPAGPAIPERVWNSSSEP